MKPLIPTTIRPSKANAQPIICLLLIATFKRIFKKKSVVMMVPPTSILKVDPEIKFKAIYCIIDSEASQKPGMAKT